MSSSEIKQVIGLLCKQLNLLLHVNLKPEYFRLAKFNKNDEDVVLTLWRTLGLLTIRNSADVNSVKEYMKTLNYSSPFFYSLPEDFSSGSRELLLAICFTVATNLQNLIKEEIRKSPFGDCFNLIDLSNLHLTHRPEVPNISNEKDCKHFVMWIKGRILQNQNMTKEYEKQSVNICAKLNKCLNFKAVDSLTLNEILALNDKKYCREFLEQSSFILELLECYQEWTKKQKIFWKWMVTVLAEREKN